MVDSTRSPDRSSPLPKPSAADIAAYVAELAGELSALAREANLPEGIASALDQAACQAVDAASSPRPSGLGADDTDPPGC